MSVPHSEKEAGRVPVTRVLAMPKDANPAGDIFGGWVISHVDVAGAIIASEYAGGRVVTVAINAAQFFKPIAVGDLVSFFVDLERIGRTSITMKVEVESKRKTGERVKVSEATVVYVAVDEKGRPKPVPKNNG